MDIRNWFSPINKKKAVSEDKPKEKKRKNIIESDDEDPLPSSKARKQKTLASDSDDDIFDVTPKSIQSAQKSVVPSPSNAKSKPKTIPKESPKQNLKPVSASDFFGSKPVTYSKKPTTKRKADEETCDTAFEKTLVQLDKEQRKRNRDGNKEERKKRDEGKEERKKRDEDKEERKKKDEDKEERKKKDEDKQEKKTEKENGEGRNREKENGEGGKREEENGERRKREKENGEGRKREKENGEGRKREKDSEETETSRKKVKEEVANEGRNEEGKKETPPKLTNGDTSGRGGGGLASKLAMKMKENQIGRGENKEERGVKEKSPHKEKEVKKESPHKEKEVKKEEEIKKKSLHKEEVKKKPPHKEVEAKKKAVPKKGKKGSHPALEISLTEGGAAKKEPLPPPPPADEDDDKKKQKNIAYHKFLQRGGPSNPGGKSLPKGLPNCLSGLTFVLTGVLSSIDRVETSSLIESHGGRVTTSVSRNTSYIIVGDEPGQSKIKKGEQLGTKLLDEDELFSFIESRPEGKGGTPKGNTPKGKQDVASKLALFAKDSPSRSPSLGKRGGEEEAASSSNGSSLPSTVSSLSSQASCSSSSSSQGTSASSQFSQDLSSSSSSSKVPCGAGDDSSLWVDKYRPTSLRSIVGQQGENSNARKLLAWLRDWRKNQARRSTLVRPSPWAKDNSGAFFKAALLSGPPGVGKTTTAHLVCKELGLDVVELNASDTRSKRALTEEVAELLSCTSLAPFVSHGERSSVDSSVRTTRARVLLMDEVDGMAGNEDRGGVQELIALIKKARVPVVCMCNDRQHPKIRSLAGHCFDLRFNKPRIEQIRSAMMSVCFREGLKMKAEALDQVILGSNQDLRQVLHHLSMWSSDHKNLDTDSVTKDAKLAKKDFKIGPWDVCKTVFSASAQKGASIHDRVSLFFHDYSIGPLFVQENYLKAAPNSATGNRRQLLAQLAKTANVIADSDIVDKAIRSNSAWSLLPTQAILSTVCPGSYMAGHLSAQVEFPHWLGNNSRKNKFDRLAQELHTHMRLRISGSKQDIITDYCSRLRESVVSPLVKKGAEGVKEAVEAMTSNDLLREDLESIMELSAWPGAKDQMARVESKVKAAFTRTLNKEGRLTPFSSASFTKTTSKGASSTSEEGDYGADDEEAHTDTEEDDDITKDSNIKKGKLSSKTSSGDARKGTSSKGKGKGKGKSSQK